MPATSKTSVPAIHIASDGAAVLKRTRCGEPPNRNDAAIVLSATVIAAKLGPYRKRPESVKASPSEKLELTEPSRWTARPLSAARTARMSAIGSTGDSSTVLTDSAMTAQPRTSTVQT